MIKIDFKAILKEQTYYLNTGTFVDLFVDPSIVSLHLFVQTAHDSIAGLNLCSGKSGSSCAGLELEMEK
jgi:hypothetical protein